MDFAAARAKLIRHLRSEIRDKRVLEALGKVPRECFVPISSRHLAYEDMPLPVTMGQTISQPLIVAMMTEALELSGEEKVLELGTGSGYQTAILAEFAEKVFSVERHPPLAQAARRLLKDLGYKNVEIHMARKRLGWAEEAPYHAVIVTAGAPAVPQELLGQLTEGGRLVIPVGSRLEQNLLQVIKRGEHITRRNLGACRFVPLIGEGAWAEE